MDIRACSAVVYGSEHLYAGSQQLNDWCMIETELINNQGGAMTIDIVEPRFDVQFKSDVLEVVNNLMVLRKRPLALAAYTQVCVSVRKAKLLLRNIERAGGLQYASANRLLELAEEAVGVAEAAEARIPAAARSEFVRLKNGLQRHVRELKELFASGDDIQ